MGKMSPSQLRAVREKLQLTQAQLADKLGLTRDAVASMEQGRRPIRPIVEIALEHLHCHPSRHSS